MKNIKYENHKNVKYKKNENIGIFLISSKISSYNTFHIINRVSSNHIYNKIFN